MHGEAHVTGLGFNPQFVQEPTEIGIGALVVDDETHVHGDFAPTVLDAQGVGMPAHMGSGFENVHIVATIEQIGRHQAGNTRTDDCYSHQESPVTESRTVAFFAGNHGKKAGVSAMYCPYAGRRSVIVFSNNETPLTLSKKRVIKSTLGRVRPPFSEPRAKIQKGPPHHRVTEVVGMPRIAPKAGVQNPSTVCRDRL